MASWDKKLPDLPKGAISPPSPAAKTLSTSKSTSTTLISPISRPESTESTDSSLIHEKHRLSQDPGIHVCVSQPGLEVYTVGPSHKFYNSPYADGNGTLEVNDGSAPRPILNSDLAEIDARRRRKRRKLLCIGLPVTLVLLLVIVIAAVFGSRAAKAKADAAAAAQNQLSQLPGPLSVKSTRGAWNGTGLMLLPSFGAINGWYQYLLVYQSFDSKVQIIPINVSATATTTLNQASVKIGMPYSLGIQVANGTGLTGHTGMSVSGMPESYQLIYISPNGTLSDVAATQDNIYQWTPGNLSTLGHKAPTDRRTQMRFDWNRCFGMSTNKSGERLWATGQDGSVHQFNYDWSSWPWSWTKDDTVVADANGYGALNWVQMRQAADSCNSDWTIVNADAKGELTYLSANMDANTNDTEWPSGPKWSAPTPVPWNASISPGGDVAAWPQWDKGDLMLFYEQQGKLQNMNVHNWFQQPLTYTAQQLPDLNVMPGSAMSSGWSWVNQSGGPLMVVYQGNGTSVDYWLSVDNQQTSGNVLW